MGRRGKKPEKQNRPLNNTHYSSASCVMTWCLKKKRKNKTCMLHINKPNECELFWKVEGYKVQNSLHLKVVGKRRAVYHTYTHTHSHTHTKEICKELSSPLGNHLPSLPLGIFCEWSSLCMQPPPRSSIHKQRSLLSVQAAVDRTHFSLNDHKRLTDGL